VFAVTCIPGPVGSGRVRPCCLDRVAWKWFAFDSLGSPGVPSAPGLLLSQQMGSQLLLSCLHPYGSWWGRGLVPAAAGGIRCGCCAVRARLKLLGPIAMRDFGVLLFSSLTSLTWFPWHMAWSCWYRARVSPCLLGRGNFISTKKFVLHHAAEQGVG